MEDILWDHLSVEISPEVVKYQVQTQTRRPNSVPVTTADVAAILCNAVKDKNLSEVDYISIPSQFNSVVSCTGTFLLVAD